MPKTVSETPGCLGCPLQRLFPSNTFVAPKKGSGDRLVIAEAPGFDETLTGEPLTGGAGAWYNIILGKAGIKRDEVHICNIIQCRPKDNIFPTDPAAESYISPLDAVEAIEHCRKAHVNPLLHGRRWKRIDLLGAKPLEFIAGKSGGIFKWRGSPVPIEGLNGGEPIAIPTLHPAYSMRDQTMLPVAINDLRKTLSIPPEEYNLYPSLPDVKAFTATEFAFDIETAYWSTGSPQITMVGLCAEPYKAIVVPFTGAYKSELQRIFKNAIAVIGHNALQFDLPILQEHGVEVGADCIVWDTMLLQHLRFPDLPHDLEFVGSQFSNKPAWKSDKAVFELYNARDVDVTLQCYKALRPMCKAAGLEDLYLNVQVPLARICKLMSETGFTINPNKIGEVREKLLAEMQREEQYLPEYLRTRQVAVKKRQPAPPGTLGKSGKPVKFIMVEGTEEETPWRSAKEIEKYLYTTLALPVQNDLKTERVTTGKMALDKLYRRTKDRSLLALKKLRQMNSLVTLFCKEQMLDIDKMHPHFNVHGTASGRLSSSDPNLQNVPESARYIYVPSHPGWKIIDVDYSQIENRLTAYFANDTERMERFIRDPKFSEHKYAASLFLGCPYDEVEKDNDKEAPYGKAKRIVHGTNYGMGAKKISMMYDMDFKDIKALQDKWKNAIYRTIQWQNTTGDLAKKQGYLTTPFGRKRWFYTSSYFTEALSFLPQSTAADCIFRAMIALMYERINWPIEQVQRVVSYIEPLPQPAQLLISVHDSLVFECPGELVDTVVGTVKRVMEQGWPELGGLSIPVGVGVGDSWGECEPYALR